MMNPYSIFPNKQIQDLQDYVPMPELFKKQDKDYIFWGCPFEVIGGAIYQTEAGLKPLDARITDYTALQEVIKNCFLVSWEDSYTLSKFEGSSEKKYYDNYGLKTWKRGTSFQGVVLDEGLGSEFIPFVGNQSFISQQITKSITLRFYNVEANKLLIDNLDKYGIYLWVLPNFAVGKWDKNPFNDESRTFFEVNNLTIKRQPNRTIAYVDVQFLSLNNKIAKTGIAVNQFVQLGGAGEGFAFPIIDRYNNLKYDTERTRPNPVTHFQIQFLGLTAFGGIGFEGRPIFEEDVKKYSLEYLYPTTEIFPFKWQAPINNKISLKSYPTNTYYWVKAFALDVVETKTKSEQFNTIYNRFTPKQVEGYIHTDYDATQATNDKNKPLVYYDENFLNDEAIWKATQKIKPVAGSTGEKMKWSILGNNNFVYLKKDKNEYLTTIKGLGNNFDYSLVPNNADVQNGFSHWNMFNLLLNKTQIELPLTFTDYTKVDAINLPIVGSLFRELTFGFLGSGWSFATNNIPKFPYFNCLIPMSAYNAYANLWVGYIGEKDKGKIVDGTLGFETFYEGDRDGVGLITGSNAITMSFAGSLTHMATFEGVKWEDGTSPLTKNLAWSDSRQLLSKIFDNADYVFEPNEKTRLQDPLTTNDNPFYMIGHNSNLEGYIIDFIQILSVGKSPYQIKFFNLSGFSKDQKNINDEDCVWMGTFNTQSKVQENIRIFRNIEMLSNSAFKFNKHFNYPKDLLPIPPTGKTEFIVEKGGDTQTFTLIYDSALVGGEHANVLLSGKELFQPFYFSKPIKAITGFNIIKIELKNVQFKTKYFEGTWAYDTTFKIGNDTVFYKERIVYYPKGSSGKAGSLFDVFVQKQPTFSIYKHYQMYRPGKKFFTDAYWGISPTLTTTLSAPEVVYDFKDDKQEWDVPFATSPFVQIDESTKNVKIGFLFQQYQIGSKLNWYRAFAFTAIGDGVFSDTQRFHPINPPVQIPVHVSIEITYENVVITYKEK